MEAQNQSAPETTTAAAENTQATESKKVISLSEEYLSNISKFAEGQLKLSQLQIQTLNDMNIKTNEVYEKNLEKLDKIKEEVQITSQFYDKMKESFHKIDDIGRAIEGMESSVDYLHVIIARIEAKFDELDKMG